jgi:flagellar biosynthesis protein FliR
VNPSLYGFDPASGAFIAALARAGGFALTAPLLGEAGTPMRARLAFAVAVAVAVSSAAPAQELGLTLALVPLELGVGALAGASARLVLDRVAAGGQLIGLHLGLGFASEYDVRAGESATTARRLLSALAGLAFLAAGGLEAGVRCIATPITATDLADLTNVVGLSTSVMTHAIAFAAPALVAATVINLGLALINRAAPAFNVFSISLTAVLIGGGLVLLATAPAMAAAIDGTARSAVDLLDNWGTR